MHIYIQNFVVAGSYFDKRGYSTQMTYSERVDRSLDESFHHVPDYHTVVGARRFHVWTRLGTFTFTCKLRSRQANRKHGSQLI